MPVSFTKSVIGIVAMLLLFTGSTFAQKTENQAWLFLTHTQKLSKRFAILLDAQTRTANQFNYLNTILLRTALSYHLNDAHALALGFAYKGDREKIEDGYDYMNEHRIYQQYLYTFKILKTEMLLRGRLEQRWVREDQTSFSQRGRVFASAQIPVFADQEFSRGVYIGIQNEVFLNLINRRRVNGRVFDQNRSFLSGGYRWNKTVDTEIGYLYWHQPELTNTYNRHVVQLQVTTSF